MKLFFFKSQINKLDAFFSIRHFKDFILAFFVPIIIPTIILVPFFYYNQVLSNSIFEEIGLVLKSHKTHSFFYVVIFGPIVEEIIFRLPINLNKSNLLISISFLLGLIFTVNSIIFKTSDLIYLNYFQFLIITIISFSILKISFRNLKDELNISTTFLFYFLSLSFSILHLLNFQTLVLENYLIYLIYIFYIFIESCAFGYLRCNYGFFSGLLLHILKNFIVFM